MVTTVYTGTCIMYEIIVTTIFNSTCIMYRECIIDVLSNFSLAMTFWYHV